MGCPDVTTDLDDEEALAILEPYFFAIREKFRDEGLERAQGEGARYRRSACSDISS